VWGNEPSHPKGVPLWGVGVLVDSQIFRGRLQGSKLNGLKFFYINGKLLEHRYLKWSRIAHLDIWNTRYGQKKGRKSNWQFDSRPLKVGNRPNLCACRWRATYSWKALDEGYNFALDLISIRGLHTKLWRPKVVRIPTLAISGLPLGSPGTKNHLDVGPMERCKVNYKGEGGGFP